LNHAFLIHKQVENTGSERAKRNLAERLCTKGRDGRPEFDRLLRDAAQRKFDMVMAWSVDRLGRSLQDRVSFLSELHALHIDLFLHQQGLDTTFLLQQVGQNIDLFKSGRPVGF
jgi:DNA invertase Pin-like site-specific DNA recombinase